MYRTSVILWKIGPDRTTDPTQSVVLVRVCSIHYPLHIIIIIGY